MTVPTNKKFAVVPVTEKVENIIKWLEEKHASDVVALSLERVNSFTDAVIIASAKSVRQAQAIAEHVYAMAKESNYEYLRVEGKDSGQWVLVDLNDVVVNVFQDDVRKLFNLESLWADATVLHQDEAN
ncbi:ribosome silencing factor [Desulfovibrio subterraneus]|jgi:ribosome-associated protein|uniref:Ribosomal silencing factor RsfS n=1 Tax=Desulfovibrio subterraneus TaxID=2718620 RepID=A0A7J0BKQ9_9BACT|nr:ribosome silencing factor [Desulfovibrio subterraneus]WBF67962.1 ribosome silencing factor [Desulfovibrio subterraneus]GFM33831.1 ribosomal silencing factor RsfS [Desulfovibrio subterraneus]